jgi:hypothetical protein
MKNIVILSHYKACIMSEAVVLGGGQLYTADRGPIRLYEDIIQALYENTHFMTPLEKLVSDPFVII